jgi:hypothetical protein
MQYRGKHNMWQKKQMKEKDKTDDDKGHLCECESRDGKWRKTSMVFISFGMELGTCIGMFMYKCLN